MLLSLVVIFFLQAPLVTFVYYGFLVRDNLPDFNINIINKIVSTDVLSMATLLIQTVLTLGFIILLFIFINKIIYIFLKNEKLIRPYYQFFFFMTSIVPVVLIFLSILLKIKFMVVIAVIWVAVFTILNIMLLIFSKKILPDTTDHEYRKYLFSEGLEDD